MSEYSLTIKINPQDLVTTLHSSLTVSSNSVFIGLSMLNDLKELPEFIYGEDEFRVHSPFGKLSLNSSKKIFRDWIIKKGFEDLIKGVSGMLGDYCNLLSFGNKKKNISTMEELHDLIYSSDEKVLEMHLPELLKRVKTNVKGLLEYEDCIRTINQVRNCLVHRNGVVSKKDTNDQDRLVLKWMHFSISHINGEGKQENIAPLVILTSTSKISLVTERKEKCFTLGQNIEITYQEFNELKDTCLLFSQDLLSKFILNKEQ